MIIKTAQQMKPARLNSTLLLSLMLIVGFISCTANSVSADRADDHKEPPQKGITPPLQVGYSIPIGGGKFSLKSLKYAKSVGVDFVEVSGIGFFVDQNRKFKCNEQEIIEKLEQVKKNADEAGIKIWSIHMPFGQNIDLSLTDEKDREEVVAMHSKLVGYLKILKPKIMLFHPSYYLGLSERDRRKAQLIKSAIALDKKVQEINAIMVIENMLGPELLKDADQERPLLRTVEETQEIMAHLPESIGLAIDLNHIKNPEKMILAMSGRLKTLHVADGTGEREDHYFPCSGKGKNDWTKIMVALEKVDYTGPFMFESAYTDEADLLQCYRSLYKDYLDQTK